MIGEDVEKRRVRLNLYAQEIFVPSWKRIFDVSCIILASPLLIPLTLFTALLIKICSPGPIFFVQERIGCHGRRFNCLKFRTMKANADQEIHRKHTLNLIRSNAPMTKIDSTGDPRLIPLGSILRATGLDELPQIVNVLRGEMSLVGPRPCLPQEFENYLPKQKQRFDSLPGLTGLWQVSGKNRTTFLEMVALDVFYVENKSLWMDLKIMAKTLPAVVSYLADLRYRDAGRPNRAESAHEEQI